ncbi:MAG: competence/damage-inducible protein A [Endomicrobium sp.]|jgi:nicotinamide-nucleotide amidase|nr:competence/damage-inducible protein A [Endomicrobium sp.]
MKIELICTGSELLAGKLNTNAAYIGSKLLSLGLNLSYITTVGDKKSELCAELQRACGRSNIIIVTGGLGPTFDDITVESVAEVLGIETYAAENVLNSIKEFFAKRAIAEIPKINERQANVIKGAKVLENRFGTAPGQMIHFEYKEGEKKIRKTIFLFPGPPREMQPLFDENAEPFFKSYHSGIRKNEALRIFGLSESAVAEMIKPVMEAAGFGEGGAVEFGILASGSIITVKYSVSGSDEMLVDDIAGNLKFELEKVLDGNIFGYGSDELADCLGKILIENKKTVALAESCTGGLVSKKITDTAGSSIYFKSSFVTYSNESKIKLGVKEETLQNFGAVSEETAKEMAECALNAADGDYAVSVTGIAGPGGATKEKPVGLVFIGVASKRETNVFKCSFHGTRKDIRERSANTALDLLRRKILNDGAAKNAKKMSAQILKGKKK